METPFDTAGGVEFSPSRHRVAECVWVAGLRGRLLNQDLFLMHHFQNKNEKDPNLAFFTLGVWRRKPTPDKPGRFIELDFSKRPVWKTNPDLMDPKHLPTDEEVKERLRFETEVMEEVLRMEKQRREHIAHLKERGRAHREDVVKFLERKVGQHKADHPSIQGIRTGHVDFETPEVVQATMGPNVGKMLNG